MINPNHHKISFDIKLPHDPESRCNKFIQKGYSFSVCLLNIGIKVGLSICMIIILLNKIESDDIIDHFKNVFKKRNETL